MRGFLFGVCLLVFLTYVQGTDGQRPDITCPKDITVSTDPGKATARIKLSKPAQVHPNAKLVFTSSVPMESDMKIGWHFVRFTVKNSAGFTAACHFRITVEDREPPKILNCPNDIIKVIDDSSVRLSWDEPKVTDNSGKVYVHLNIPNRSRFYIGTTRNVTYSVYDRAMNTNSCSFQVTIKLTCKDFNLPPNLHAQCSIPADDPSKCDTQIPRLPPNLKWKDICRKTCKACH